MMRFLIKHVGNMGDHMFMVPPVLATLKHRYPDCHVTLVTAWGFKQKTSLVRRMLSRGGVPTHTWGQRNQGGYCLALMMTNPHVDQLVHWHDTTLSLDGRICVEEKKGFPTWNRDYFEAQKNSGRYDGVFELDFGLTYEDNPIARLYETVGLPEETYSNYRLYLTASDRAVAEAVMRDAPKPRIVLLEGIEGTTTRGWDPDKVRQLEASIQADYGVGPIWFGSRHVPEYHGRSLTLRENIATLTQCDAAIGVMSGPLHFAAAIGLPTLTLYADQPLHRAAPAYFLNEYIEEPTRRHQTILGPSPATATFLKSDRPPIALTPPERAQQHYHGWQDPGRQATKSALAPITVDEVLMVLKKMVSPSH